MREHRRPYKLVLSEEDLATIVFVGTRYGWSEALAGLEAGENELTESEAWCIRDAFESDTVGGHWPFPMLDPQSHLYVKLATFWATIV